MESGFHWNRDNRIKPVPLIVIMTMAVVKIRIVSMGVTKRSMLVPVRM